MVWSGLMWHFFHVTTIWKLSLKDSIYNLLTYSPSLHYKPFTFSSDQKPKNLGRPRHHRVRPKPRDLSSATQAARPSELRCRWVEVSSFSSDSFSLWSDGFWGFYFFNLDFRWLLGWGGGGIWILSGCWGGFGWINAWICGLNLGLWKFEKGEWEKNWVWVSRNLKIFVL